MLDGGCLWKHAPHFGHAAAVGHAMAIRAHLRCAGCIREDGVAHQQDCQGEDDELDRPLHRSTAIISDFMSGALCFFGFPSQGLENSRVQSIALAGKLEG
jgi:hypothetical protein